MSDPHPNFLQPFLAGRDVACPGCGYNLRDLAGLKCPECGDEIVLQVGLSEPKQAAALAGLVGLAAGAGLNGLLLIYLLIRVMAFNDSSGGIRRFMEINLSGLLVQCAALGLWTRNWRKIRRLQTRRKWLLVVACWGLTLANLVVFSVSIK